MPLFRKRFPSRSDIRQGAETVGWAVATGNLGGKDAILRSWKPAKELRGHPEFPRQVGVAIPFRAPDGRGFPSPEENAQVNRIEDLLVAALSESNESLFVGTITTGGMKEFVFYTSNSQRAAEKVEAIRRTVTTHEVQLNIQDDPEWRVHREFFSW